MRGGSPTAATAFRRESNGVVVEHGSNRSCMEGGVRSEPRQVNEDKILRSDDSPKRGCRWQHGNGTTVLRRRGGGSDGFERNSEVGRCSTTCTCGQGSRDGVCPQEWQSRKRGDRGGDLTREQTGR
jgi:hypothetical protein